MTHVLPNVLGWSAYLANRAKKCAWQFCPSTIPMSPSIGVLESGNCSGMESTLEQSSDVIQWKSARAHSTSE